jgi:peroxiredoxin
MALEYSTASVLGSVAPDFALRGVDDRMYSLESFKSGKGLLVVFMCNHCPYVIAVYERLNQLANEFSKKGIAVVGINSNDPLYKEADSFPNMKITSAEWKLPFPYLFDETQSVARAYDAVCTPDPYLYENVGGRFLLRYRGRIDDSWKDETKVRDQSLREAMLALLEGRAVGDDQIPSMGCSIKWKELTAAALERKRKEAEGKK